MPGKNSERHGHAGRDYNSRRIYGMVPWNKSYKQLTHRRERAAARRLEHGARVAIYSEDDLYGLDSKGARRPSVDERPPADRP